jgi:uncharacterized membrane protein YraQ (UPF0718 family)
MKDRTKLILIVSIFGIAYFLPIESIRVQSAILEAFHMLKEYAREHVLFCLVPAFFIAGAIGVFIRQEAVMKYFGSRAKKMLSYSVASVSGTILAVCSCTVLPIFAGIYRRGAGIGPATTFLYSGPAINVLAVILTARVLGPELGIGRALGAVVFSVVIGLLMSLVFRQEENRRKDEAASFAITDEEKTRPMLKTGLYFFTLVLILIFAAWGKPREPVGFWNAVHSVHWPVTAGLLILLAVELKLWFRREELSEWTQSTWGFAWQILPLLFAGVLIAGLLMGRPNADSGLIPASFIENWVGGNSLPSNLFAAVAGAFMYFATLTEVPILQGLLGSGMGQGPALALLLAGPALSLPNMFVIRSVLGTKKTIVYIILVIIMAAISGLIFGSIVG